MTGKAHVLPEEYDAFLLLLFYLKFLLAKRRKNYIYKSRNLLPYQFGFRNGLGTCDNLLILTHDLHIGFVGCWSAKADFSSAVDMLNHKPVLFKLKSVGVLDINSEFVTARKQRVVVDD